MSNSLPKGIKERILKDGTTVYDCIVGYKDKMTGKWKLKTKTAPRKYGLKCNMNLKMVIPNQTE